ncbi:hypothetical protein ACFDR9_000328 [Janthinobacterium sp. CG_23.3]
MEPQSVVYSAASGAYRADLVRPWFVLHRSGDAGAVARRDKCELASESGWGRSKAGGDLALTHKSAFEAQHKMHGQYLFCFNNKRKQK